MKKTLKRLCTGFLALATVVTALPTTPVHAESKQYWTESKERVGIVEKVMNDGSIGSTFNEGHLTVEGEDAYCIDINTDFRNGYKTRADASTRMSADQISDVAEKCRKREYIGKSRSYKFYQSGELIKHREDDREYMGRTLYLGSLKSDVYFCIYEKDYEQYVKLGTPLEEADIINRFEIRLRNERAYYAVRDLLTYRSLSESDGGGAKRCHLKKEQLPFPYSHLMRCLEQTKKQTMEFAR